MLDAQAIATIAEKFGPNFPTNDEGVAFVRKWFEDHGFDPLAISGAQETTQQRQPLSPELAKEFLANCVDAGMRVANFSEVVSYLERFIDGDIGPAQDSARRHDGRLLDTSIYCTRYSSRSRASSTSISDSFAKAFPEAARITDTTWGKQ